MKLVKVVSLIILFWSFLGATEPSWLYNPSNETTIGAVGHAAPNENKKLQRKIALIDAKAKLSETIRIKIENETSKSSTSDGDSSFERKSTQTSDNLVRGAKVKDEYVDEDGGLYLWLVNEK